MTNQPTLFQAYKAYLENIKNFLHRQKEQFQTMVKTKTPENNNSVYDEIVQNANNEIIKKIDTAIQDISIFIENLEQEKKQKIQDARDTLPSKKRNT